MRAKGNFFSKLLPELLKLISLFQLLLTFWQYFVRYLLHLSSNFWLSSLRTKTKVFGLEFYLLVHSSLQLLFKLSYVNNHFGFNKDLDSEPKMQLNCLFTKSLFDSQVLLIKNLIKEKWSTFFKSTPIKFRVLPKHFLMLLDYLLY